MMRLLRSFWFVFVVQLFCIWTTGPLLSTDGLTLGSILWAIPYSALLTVIWRRFGR